MEKNYIMVGFPTIPYFKKRVKNFFRGVKIREWMHWGTYGKNGDQPLKYVLLKDMSDEHIQAILETQVHIKGSFYEKQFKKELKRRTKYPYKYLSIREKN
jgi:hypothetical protein